MHLVQSALRFSALQRAEIAEIGAVAGADHPRARSFSALQRAEIAEIKKGWTLYE